MLEQEIKIPVAAFAPVRGRLAELRARCQVPFTLEDNWVLDDDHGSLAASGRLLRVRRAGQRCWVTLKEPASFEGGVKSRVELETGVADADGALAVFRRLGFAAVRRYQKRRETWAFGDFVVALDETPLGGFVEVEGPGDRLAAAAVDLGLNPATAARGTYLDLWHAYRALHPDAPPDMLFSAESAVRPE